MIFTQVVKRSIYSNRTVTIKRWLASFNFYAIAYLLSIFIWLSECTFYNIWLAITISIEYITTIYSNICMAISSYIACLYRDHPHIIHVIHSIHVQLCMIFVYCYTWSCVACWVLLLERAFSSVLLNVQDVAESCTCSTTCVLWTHWNYS